MSAYPAAATLVLRSAIPRTAELRTPEPRVVEPVERRTRFTVVTAPYPASSHLADGAGQCSECPESGPINSAVGEVRYDSKLFRGPITEAVCLPCLPGLIQILDGLDEGPLEVALYSPCAGANTHRISRIDHERAELVGMLVAAKGPLTAVMLGQLFAAAGAQLRKIAEVAS